MSTYQAEVARYMTKAPLTIEVGDPLLDFLQFFSRQGLLKVSGGDQGFRGGDFGILVTAPKTAGPTCKLRVKVRLSTKGLDRVGGPGSGISEDFDDLRFSLPFAQYLDDSLGFALHYGGYDLAQESRHT